MKKFFEEYGKIIVIAIVVLILLALVPFVGAKVQDNVLNLPIAESDTLFNIDESETKVVIEGTMAKGNIVTIDSKEYRVLSVNGTEAKLLAMYDATRMNYDADRDEITSFNGIDGNQYAGSDLDNYLENEFYPSLSFKDAIVPQNITQNMYKRTYTLPTSGTYYTSWYKDGFTSSDTSGETYYIVDKGSVNVGSRHVYVLDVKDMLDYLGDNFTPQQFNTMFFNTNSSYSGFSPDCAAWLRSASTSAANYPWYIYGAAGILVNDYHTSAGIRPAFVIDLTKCEYTK